MQYLNKDALKQFDDIAEKRKAEILSAPDNMTVTGNRYYVSNDGSDDNDGRTPASAWATLKKVSSAKLLPGDGVFFRRDDLFRGEVMTAPGVTYAAYGEGEKPKLYGWDYSLADPDLWELYDEEHHIWRMKNKILDCGTLVFNDGEAHCRKLIPSYIGGRFVCRDDESRPFEMAKEMTRDLDLVCFYDERLTTTPSKGEDFPIPLLDAQSYGDLYLRCDKGNPGAIYDSVEALPRRCMMRVKGNANVRIDNLCMKYIGIHAVSGGGAVVKGLHVTNCEIGWIGGVIQHYSGTDPNYPQGRRGTVTRYGNGVEIYGGCEDYLVANCYVYQAYDAGITHQVTTRGKKYTMTGIRYLDNLVENCVYSIEYFLDQTEGDRESYIDDCVMRGNILRLSGYGWGQQRHNTDTPAHIKGWSYVNTARNYTIEENLFDRAAYRMLHLVAEEDASCPVMKGNTYVQAKGMKLGQYGGNKAEEPENMDYGDDAEERIKTVMGEEDPEVYVIL